MRRAIVLIVLLAPVVAAGQLPTQLPVEGKVTYYAPGVMDEVISNRAAFGLPACPDCVDGLAMPYCADLGRRVWLSAEGLCFGPLHVVDCAAPVDLPRFVVGGYIGEVSWPVSRKLHMAGPIHAVISQSSCLEGGHVANVLSRSYKDRPGYAAWPGP